MMMRIQMRVVATKMRNSRAYRCTHCKLGTDYTRNHVYTDTDADKADLETQTRRSGYNLALLDATVRCPRCNIGLIEAS